MKRSRANTEDCIIAYGNVGGFDSCLMGNPVEGMKIVGEALAAEAAFLRAQADAMVAAADVLWWKR